MYFSGNISSSEAFLSHSEASKLLNPLLKLRQACCHPQVGTSSGLRSLQQSPMTMEEILDVKFPSLFFFCSLNFFNIF